MDIMKKNSPNRHCVEYLNSNQIQTSLTSHPLRSARLNLSTSMYLPRQQTFLLLDGPPMAGQPPQTGGQKEASKTHGHNLPIREPIGMPAGISLMTPCRTGTGGGVTLRHRAPHPVSLPQLPVSLLRQNSGQVRIGVQGRAAGALAAGTAPAAGALRTLQIRRMSA